MHTTVSPPEAGWGPPKGRHAAAYDVLGVPIELRSADPEPIDLIDRSYRAFRVAQAPADAILIDVEHASQQPGWWAVRGGGLEERTVPTPGIAAIDAMERLVHVLVSGLHAQGRWAIHAGAAVHRGRAIILSGPSGTGKTTLVLALARRGLGLLSDDHYAKVRLARRERVWRDLRMRGREFSQQS